VIPWRSNHRNGARFSCIEPTYNSAARNPSDGSGSLGQAWESWPSPGNCPTPILSAVRPEFLYVSEVTGLVTAGICSVTDCRRGIRSVKHFCWLVLLPIIRFKFWRCVNFWKRTPEFLADQSHSQKPFLIHVHMKFHVIRIRRTGEILPFHFAERHMAVPVGIGRNLNCRGRPVHLKIGQLVSEFHE
jgi:hypothetical protein